MNEVNKTMGDQQKQDFCAAPQRLMKKEVIMIILSLLLVGCTTKFPEVMTGQFRDPIAPCMDSGNIYKAGWARDYYSIRYDYCLDEKTLYEAVCINFQFSGHAQYICEKGCVNGACKQQ